MDYPWIRAWGVFNDLDQEETDERLEAARAYSAPSLAVYKNRYEPWTTLDQVANAAFRSFALDWSADFNVVIPDRVLRVWVSGQPSDQRRYGDEG